MNIPDKAVEAAAKAAYDDAFMAHAPDYLPRYDEEDAVVKDSWRDVARVSLEAAAPFIAAQALRDEAERIEALEKDSGPERMRAYLRAKSLRISANRLEFPL